MNNIEKRMGNEGLPLLSAFFLSCLLHSLFLLPSFMSDDQKRVVDDIVSNMNVTRELIQNNLVSLPRILEKIEFIEKLKKSPDDIGFADFILKSEYYEGGIDADELENAKIKLNAMIKKYQKLDTKEENKLKVLHEIIQEQGSYKRSSSFLGNVVNERSGNCEARSKLMVALVKGVYPNMPVKFQIYADHILTIVEVDNKWYKMEKPLITSLEKEDYIGTAIADISIYIKEYINEKIKTKVFPKTNNKEDKRIINYNTDTYFSLIEDKNVYKKLSNKGLGEIPKEIEETIYNFDGSVRSVVSGDNNIGENEKYKKTQLISDETEITVKYLTPSYFKEEEKIKKFVSSLNTDSVEVDIATILKRMIKEDDRIDTDVKCGLISKFIKYNANIYNIKEIRARLMHKLKDYNKKNNKSSTISSIMACVTDSNGAIVALDEDGKIIIIYD